MRWCSRASSRAVTYLWPSRQQGEIDMDNVVLGFPQIGGRPAWLDVIERELATHAEVAVVARRHTTDGILESVREQLVRRRHVVVVCALELDEGTVTDVIRGCQQLGVGVVPVLSPTQAPVTSQVLRAARVPVLVQPGSTASLVD